MSKYKNNQQGFTLIELVVVAAVLAILAGIGFVSYNVSITNAEESVCLANRKQIHAIFLSYQSHNPDATLEGFLNGDYGDIDMNFDISCPHGGQYYLGDDGQIRCDEHSGDNEEDQTAAEGGEATFTPQPTATPPSSSGGSSSGGSSGSGGSGTPDETPDPSAEPTAEATEEPTPAPTPTNTPTPTPSPTPEPATVPGTDIIVQNSYWPQTQDFDGDDDGVITVNSGGVFEYQNSHYVVTNDIDLTQSDAAYGPAGGDAQKLTGTVIEYPSGTTWIKNVRKGDICKVGDDYYVYTDSGKWACNPDVMNYQWYSLPSN